LAVVNIEGHHHDPLSPPLDEFRHFARSVQIFHDFECRGPDLEICDTDLLIKIFLAPCDLPSKGLLEILLGLGKVSDGNADVVYIVGLERFSYSSIPPFKIRKMQ